MDGKIRGQETGPVPCSPEDARLLGDKFHNCTISKNRACIFLAYVAISRVPNRRPEMAAILNYQIYFMAIRDPKHANRRGGCCRAFRFARPRPSGRA